MTPSVRTANSFQSFLYIIFVEKIVWPSNHVIRLTIKITDFSDLGLDSRPLGLGNFEQFEYCPLFRSLRLLNDLYTFGGLNGYSGEKWMSRKKTPPS